MDIKKITNKIVARFAKPETQVIPPETPGPFAGENGNGLPGQGCPGGP